MRAPRRREFEMTMSYGRFFAALIFGTLVGGVNLAAPASAADGTALWDIVSQECVPHLLANRDPSPCEHINDAGTPAGIAILKDRIGATHFLAIPTRRISGIESPEILGDDAQNWFARAWDARRYVFARLGKDLSRDNIGLAINSKISRSQGQLHIHIECVLPEVKSALADIKARIASEWSSDTITISGKKYRVRRIDQPALDGINPFHLVALGPEKERIDMGRATIVIVGATFDAGHDGFILLAGHADTAEDYGHGSSLLDRWCAVGRGDP